MKNSFIKIAGYVLEFEPEEGYSSPKFGDRFRNFFCREPESSDILIRLHKGRYSPADSAEVVFSAPYTEEIDGKPVVIGNEFWTVFRDKSDIIISCLYPGEENRKGWIRLSLTSREWDIWSGSDNPEADPLPYPADSLLLYYLTVMNGDIFIHASAADIGGKGYLFSGVSGRGKSTMAGLLHNAGAKIIHDDRVIIRHNGGGYYLHNTPVYNDESPRTVQLNRIFLIEHGRENNIFPLTGATAVSNILSNCIQHNWNYEIVARLMGSVSIMCNSVPSFRLAFRPDRSIIDFLRDYE